MTREEAIEALTSKDVCNSDIMLEALDMAIEALEQEPCEDCRNCKKWNDCECGKKGHENGTSIGYSVGDCRNYEPCEDAISRQAVLDGLASIAKAKAKSDAQKSLMGRTMFFVEHLPSVQPKAKWIPVDYDRYPETYPKAFQEVWVTDGYGEVYHKAYDGTRSIKAWMPYIIPEPYKESSETKQGLAYADQETMMSAT